MMDGSDYQKLLDIERAERDRQRIMRLNNTRMYNRMLDKLSREAERLTQAINKFRELMPLSEDENNGH